MSGTIVDAFEAIKINKKDGNAKIAALCGSQQLLQAVVNQCAVRQTAQWVMRCLVVKASFGKHQRRNIAEYENSATRFGIKRRHQADRYPHRARRVDLQFEWLGKQD